MVKHGVFGIFSKTALRIFLISWQNINFNCGFQPAKTVHEKKKKKKKFRSYFRSKMNWGSILDDHLLYIYILLANASILLKLSENDHLMFGDEVQCLSGVLTKSRLCLPKLLLLNDPFPIILFLALKWWDLNVTFSRGSWINYGVFKSSWSKLTCV